MTKLVWRIAPVTDLSQMLVGADLEKSTAIGNVNLYHFQVEGQEKIAVALADGQTLVIEINSKESYRRRRIDDDDTESL
ncbi:hypothetical protein [Undibacterium sp. RuRC25W]|uniref:hypothetical protein n=1 Tax=Undibacterium sp. RuRC25W TaxID=3413047 RepID=UPI003BF01814